MTQQNQMGLLSQIQELHMGGSQTLPRLPELDRRANQDTALGGFPQMTQNLSNPVKIVIPMT